MEWIIGFILVLFYLIAMPLLVFGTRSDYKKLESELDEIKHQLNAAVKSLSTLKASHQKEPDFRVTDARNAELKQQEPSESTKFPASPFFKADPCFQSAETQTLADKPVFSSVEISIPDLLSVSDLEIEALFAPVSEVPPKIIPKVPTTSPIATATTQSPLAGQALERPRFTPSAAPGSMPVAIRPQWLDRLIAWCVGGNPLVRVGILILFFGVSFLLKLAVDHGWFPLELRLAGVALGAAALLGIGWRLREKRRNYGLLLQGGGAGILYLVIYAAFAYFKLLPEGSSLFAFLLLFIVCALSAFLAVRQDASALAVMGMTGGFAAPVLISTGSGNHIALFSYFTLLNAGVFGIAWFRAWRALNLLGFAFTLGVGSVWGMKYYTSANLFSVECFLVLFFLFYAAVALLYAIRRELELKRYVDGTLVFGTPIAFSLLQARLVGEIEFGMAWSAAALGAFYLLLATWLARYRLERLRLLFESMLALGVLFLTLAVPLAFEGTRLTAAIWAVESAGLCWVAVQQRHTLALASGLALQGFAAVSFFYDPSVSVVPESLLVLNSWYIGALMLTSSALFCGWLLRSTAARSWHRLADFGQFLSRVLVVIGLFWWFGSGYTEILRYFGSFELHSYAYLLFAVLTAWLAHTTGRYLRWTGMEWLALALSPALFVVALLSFFYGFLPLAGRGLFAWPLATILAYALLFQQERHPVKQFFPAKILGSMHALMFWTLCLIAGLEFHEFVAAYVPEGVWQWSSWAFVGALLLLALIHIGPRFDWPVGRFRPYYLTFGAAPVALLALGWAFLGLASEGNPDPLPYLPLLNPVELCQLLIFATLFFWGRANKETIVNLSKETSLGTDSGVKANVLIAWLMVSVMALLFLLLNAALLRTLHNYAGIDYRVGAVIAELDSQLYFVALWVVFVAVGTKLLQRVDVFQQRVFLPLILLMLSLLWFWSIFSNFSADSSKWGAFPLLNPFDLAQAGIVALFFFALAQLRAMDARLIKETIVNLSKETPLGTDSGAKANVLFAWLMVSVMALLFLLLNAALLRTLHNYAGIDYRVGAVIAELDAQLCFVALWVVFVAVGMKLLQRVDVFQQRVFLPFILLMLSLLWFWSVSSNFSADSSKWGTFPLLNPFDLAQAGIVALFLFALARLRAMDARLIPLPDPSIFPAMLGGSGFLWLNAMLLRALHHWLSIPYQFDAFYASMTAQAALSLLWGFLALILMVWAVRRAQRVPWFAGITLLVLTIGKLFFVELASIGSTERIFSFIGVGVLLLVIGFFAPLPPKKDEPV